MEGMEVRETETGIGGLPGMVCEYRIAFGVERKNKDDAMEGFAFFGVFGLAGRGFAEMSAKTEGMGWCKAIGGGAAESKDEARVVAGLVKEVPGRLSWNVEGCMVWLHRGKVSKFKVEGNDSRSESSSGNGDGGTLEELCSASRSTPSPGAGFDDTEEVFGRDEDDIGVSFEDV